jgi:hypothetical protein
MIFDILHGRLIYRVYKKNWTDMNLLSILQNSY